MAAQLLATFNLQLAARLPNLTAHEPSPLLAYARSHLIDVTVMIMPTEDAPVKGNNHRGWREGAGRPAGSRNCAKNKPAVSVSESVHTTHTTNSSITNPAKTSTKHKPGEEVTSSGRGITNFWYTRVPQGIQ
ncbi:hypothetical protein B0H17DRAFT_1134100 [Mycena rosella]|uniref:Uncharacterized protein n=1 Tax=Mycena rosella TaxID=1033263 RepID=A0AAD7DI74_MYCRO|nr:hypothetical protein B0H17DRAFT_1134100 [Mycena rosella]